MEFLPFFFEIENDGCPGFSAYLRNRRFAENRKFRCSSVKTLNNFRTAGNRIYLNFVFGRRVVTDFV